jgi:hypothetical protein
MTQHPGQAVQHPAPHRGAVNGAVIALAILAGPAAWALQLLVNYGLASLACFPAREPHMALPPGWHGLPVGLLAGTLVAMSIAIIAGLLGYRSWVRTNAEAGGGHRHLIEVGEGRTRFLASWGLWIGALFSVALVFDAVGILLVTSCGD